MDIYTLADCLWDWGGITLSLSIIGYVVEYNCERVQDKLDWFEYQMEREEDGV